MMHGSLCALPELVGLSVSAAGAWQGCAGRKCVQTCWVCCVGGGNYSSCFPFTLAASQDQDWAGQRSPGSLEQEKALLGPSPALCHPSGPAPAAAPPGTLGFRGCC